MKYFRTCILIFLFTSVITTNAQTIELRSPDNNIVVTINNGENLTYSVSFLNRSIVNTSQLGFELKDEPDMAGNFNVIDQSIKTFNEKWIPVVKSKHAEVLNHYN